MKIITNIIGTASLAALVCVGCKQSETTEMDTYAPGEAVEEVSIEETVIEEVSIEETVVEEVSIVETVTETAETAKAVVSDASAKAQEILTQAQKLVSEKKYLEAGSLLQKLSDFKLTPEQQKTFAGLTDVVEDAMTSGAAEEGTKAIGNVLGGEK